MSRFIKVGVENQSDKIFFYVNLKKRCLEEFKREILARDPEKQIFKMYYRVE